MSATEVLKQVATDYTIPQRTFVQGDLVVGIPNLPHLLSNNVVYVVVENDSQSHDSGYRPHPRFDPRGEPNTAQNDPNALSVAEYIGRGNTRGFHQAVRFYRTDCRCIRLANEKDIVLYDDYMAAKLKLQTELELLENDFSKQK